ncbi:EamA family transporter [Chitinophaga sp. SYP-B3965]|uniref:DMT family transporter n=1 Tax=Chitinophaga sp. SYP-B3965 TaxID=2663120 RepID=UPI001299F7A7|nr:DMT family transporter [Chitinophaga sp. SYP-B3965]MRG49094.1 EamA family transporter [Chitinophaga sp. SYP-B3965]
MDQRLLNWGIFLLLSLTWGSSFILMKLGLESFNPYQVASLRLIAGGLALLPFFLKAIREVPKNKIPLIIVSGLLGNGIPAYLFCIAETRIDSSLAGMLNSFTPVFALFFGLVIFRAPVAKRQLMGLAIGFIGVICLFLAKGIDTNEYWYYGFFVVLATACYGLNITIVHHYLKGHASMHLVAISLFFMAVFALPILLSGDFFTLFQGEDKPWMSLGASVLLGVMGTGYCFYPFLSADQVCRNYFCIHGHLRFTHCGHWLGIISRGSHQYVAGIVLIRDHGWGVPCEP